MEVAGETRRGDDAMRTGGCDAVGAVEVSTLTFCTTSVVFFCTTSSAGACETDARRVGRIKEEEVDVAGSDFVTVVEVTADESTG